MPIHDWSRVDEFVFQEFRGVWISMLRSALNTGILPIGYYALTENPPHHRRLAIRDVIAHRLIAIIAIITPADKGCDERMEELLSKMENTLASGVNLLIVDLFKPGKYDPHGLCDTIWKRLGNEAVIPSPGEPLANASYVATNPVQAYLDPYTFGQTLLDMPLFLGPDTYVATPLETTYQTTWRGTPEIYRTVLEAT